ncbi:hypothetical protein PHLGIDRAFT_118095 [Phlebiopsis gigantea 11061_1 CR5-6]|uniref:DUF6593 domain-containing protein n=1 Tax=Phlebiopsis gigantea (strain 11061_1 CR5-6) TaxID=745531 RepID=A0A0C3PLU8_PHLG1|nr:hypothetical protein PHLGIDRAFT_118095 [Phlebiopsis gigantea 11061_1 CR5-6]
MARIHWHWTSSSRLVWNGEIKDVEKMMPNTGIVGSRVFTAPDGNQYKWRMRITGCQLELKNGSKPQPIVARTRQKFTDIFTRTKPSLEIDESLRPFLDLIVITWVHIADEFERAMTSVAAS